MGKITVGRVHCRPERRGVHPLCTSVRKIDLDSCAELLAAGDVCDQVYPRKNAHGEPEGSTPLYGILELCHGNAERTRRFHPLVLDCLRKGLFDLNPPSIGWGHDTWNSYLQVVVAYTSGCHGVCGPGCALEMTEIVLGAAKDALARGFYCRRAGGETLLDFPLRAGHLPLFKRLLRELDAAWKSIDSWKLSVDYDWKIILHGSEKEVPGLLDEVYSRPYLSFQPACSVLGAAHLLLFERPNPRLLESLIEKHPRIFGEDFQAESQEMLRRHLKSLAERGREEPGLEKMVEAFYAVAPLHHVCPETLRLVSCMGGPVGLVEDYRTDAEKTRNLLRAALFARQ